MAFSLIKQDKLENAFVTLEKIKDKLYTIGGNENPITAKSYFVYGIYYLESSRTG